MKRFKVAGDVLRQQYPEATKLEKIFFDIERELDQKKMVVCQFILNGKPVEEDDEALVSQQFIEKIHTLEFLCQQTESLIFEIVSSWRDALPELYNYLQSTDPAKVDEDGAAQLSENYEMFMDSMVSLRKFLGNKVSAGFVQWASLEHQSLETQKKLETLFLQKKFYEQLITARTEIMPQLNEWEKILKVVSALQNQASHGPVAPIRRKLSH